MGPTRIRMYAYIHIRTYDMDDDRARFVFRKHALIVHSIYIKYCWVLILMSFLINIMRTCPYRPQQHTNNFKNWNKKSCQQLTPRFVTKRFGDQFLPPLVFIFSVIFISTELHTACVYKRKYFLFNSQPLWRWKEVHNLHVTGND